MLSIRKVRLLITSRYISMQSYECVIISKMFLIYFISYGCNGGALVFLGGAEASASPSFALPLFITIKKIIILHLFLGVPAATVGGTGTPWHTRGYAPGLNKCVYIHGVLPEKQCPKKYESKFSTNLQNKAWGMLSSLVVSAACSGCYYFNNLLYKEWVANDDKDCSIIPIKLRRY